MISYSLVLFSHAFVNRRPSRDLRLSVDFLWFCLFSLGFAMFLVDFGRRPSLDLRVFYDFYGFVWFSYGSIDFSRRLDRSPFIL